MPVTIGDLNEPYGMRLPERGSLNQPESLFPPPLDPANLTEREPLSYAYRPAAAVPHTTEFVVTEFLNGHNHLSDLYSDCSASAYVEMPVSAWINPRRAIAYLEASLLPSVRGVFLVTLDPFSRTEHGAAALIEGIAHWNVPTVAIQHRLPETAEQHRILAEVAEHLHCVIGLGDEVVSHLKGHCHLTNVAKLPLHPPDFRYVVPGDADRTKIMIGADRGHVVFGIIGDAREGKGIDLALAAVDHLSTSVRESVFFLIAGRARELDPDAIIDRFAARGIAARVDLRRSRDPTLYTVLTTLEYANAIAATDFGLLLYQGGQRNAMSGALSNFVWQRKRILATRDSFVGTEVARHDLGFTLDVETPEALAKLITEAVALRQAGTGLSMKFEAYRSAISPDSTLSAVETLLRSTSDTLH